MKTTSVESLEAKRPFWQLHLSTALLLVLLLGILLGLDIGTGQVAESAYHEMTLQKLMEDGYFLFAIIIEVFLLTFVVVAFERDIRRNQSHANS